VEPDRHDEPLADDRWARIEGAKTPEELADALRPRRLKTRSGLGRAARILASLAVVAAWLAAWVLPQLVPDERERSPAAPAERPPPSLALPTRPVVNVVPLYGSEAGISEQINPRAWPSYDPEWRPDGKALLVTTRRQSSVEIPRPRDGRPDWSRMRTLTGENAGSPSYSPSGALVVDHNGPYIRVIDPETSEVRRLSLPGELVPRGVDWSTDNRLAVVTRTRLFILRPDGKLLREIELPREAAFPDWSPDGTRILLTQLRPVPQVRVLSLASGVSRPLVRTDAASAWGSWSPDGLAVAFAKFVDGNWDVFVVEAEGGNERRLASLPVAEISPAWSPDGRWLAYVTEQP
jgi:Tol biopolymer transport system component